MKTEREIIKSYCKSRDIKEEVFYIYSYRNTIDFCFYNLRIRFNELLNDILKLIGI